MTDGVRVAGEATVVLADLHAVYDRRAVDTTARSRTPSEKARNAVHAAALDCRAAVRVLEAAHTRLLAAEIAYRNARRPA